jgi:hypothetical protein
MFRVSPHDGKWKQISSLQKKNVDLFASEQESVNQNARGKLFSDMRHCAVQ